MKNRLMKNFIIFVIVLSVICMNSMVAMAFDYGSINDFNLFRFYGETSNHSLSGTYTIIDSNEFLALVSACMQVNDGFREWSGQDPYAVMSARFNDSTSQDFMVVTFAPREYMYKETVLADPPVDPIMVNGLLLDPYNHDGFILYDSNCLFDDSLTVNNAFGNSYKLLVAKNDADRVLCFDIGTQPVMATILARLTSIRNDVAIIKPYMSDFSTVLTNIYYALGTLDTDLGNLNNRLQSINTEITAIKGLCQSLLGNSNSELSLLNSYLPEFDDDLDDIITDLTLFRTNFATYATAALSEMQDANESLEDINGTLSDINDMLNGKALEDVSVNGSMTSGSGSLWGLIKRAFGSALSGFAQFFDSITYALSYFVVSGGNGFGTIANIDQYVSIPYTPTDVTTNYIPSLDYTWYSPLGFNIVANGDTVHIYRESNISASNQYAGGTIATISLGAGHYQFTCGGDSYNHTGYVTLQKSNGSVIASGNSSSFTLNTSTTLQIKGFAYRSGIYDITLTPKLYKVG